MLYFAGDDERLERGYLRDQVLAMINFEMFAAHSRHFNKTAEAEVCRQVWLHQTRKAEKRRVASKAKVRASRPARSARIVR